MQPEPTTRDALSRRNFLQEGALAATVLAVSSTRPAFAQDTLKKEKTMTALAAKIDQSNWKFQTLAVLIGTCLIAAGAWISSGCTSFSSSPRYFA